MEPDHQLSIRTVPPNLFWFPSYLFIITYFPIIVLSLSSYLVIITASLQGLPCALYCRRLSPFSRVASYISDTHQSLPFITAASVTYGKGFLCHAIHEKKSELQTTGAEGLTLYLRWAVNSADGAIDVLHPLNWCLSYRASVVTTGSRQTDWCDHIQPINPLSSWAPNLDKSIWCNYKAFSSLF